MIVYASRKILDFYYILFYFVDFPLIFILSYCTDLHSIV